MSLEMRLKAKYAKPKPKGRNKANYSGNSGPHGVKGRHYPTGMRKRLKRGAKRYG